MITEDKKIEYVRRLILARMHLLSTHGFFGLLLMHAEFALDFDIETAATDGKKIYFSPSFMDSLSDKELQFVLMHEIMHIAFGHCLRQGNRDNARFNIACDIVINSCILQASDWDKDSITLKKWGESMHVAPNKREGCLYTAEEVYEMLPNLSKGKKKGVTSESGGTKGQNNSDNKNGNGWDNHDKWKNDKSEPTEEELEMQAEWQQRVKNAAKAIEIRESVLGVGKVPLLAERLLKELSEPQIDWREILSNFIQEEIADYSFSPPDKRYGDSPFFLPDLNDTEVSVKNILFMIDTSGSMDDKMVTAAYSEIKGAIDQFDGKLQGLLGFFEAEVVPPVPFYDEESFKVIKPRGGGGTDFSSVFHYVEEKMKDDLPASIIILTDGYDSFPKESSAHGIPVLWVINNEDVNPPWGKVARIKI